MNLCSVSVGRVVITLIISEVARFRILSTPKPNQDFRTQGMKMLLYGVANAWTIRELTVIRDGT